MNETQSNPNQIVETPEIPFAQKEKDLLEAGRRICICGKPLPINPSGTIQYFCSKKCRKNRMKVYRMLKKQGLL